MTAESVAIVLAAGKGTRMKSDLAKVLFPLCERPLLHHVLNAVEGSRFDRTLVVVGHQADRVKDSAGQRNVEFVLQEPQLGTGHAVQCAAQLLEGYEGGLAVLAGDAPLIRSRTLDAMMAHHHDSGAAVTILTAFLPDPAGYGRIVRDPSGQVIAIIEDVDCTPEQRAIQEINSSIYAFDYPFLAGCLPRLAAENRQGEFYLTDTVGMAFAEGLPVEGMVVGDHREVSGINTADQLREAETVMRENNRDG
jgi:UDP-N-acetylglucosamine diphosphorylase/glucosamine-1-phosphate N-acetyltransferase